MNYRIKWLGSACCVTMMLGLASCAEGFDDNERFSQGAGVKNTQLEAPQLEEKNLKVQINSDGSESVDVSWPVIYGAGGYLANVSIVDNPEEPIKIVKDSTIDGCHFSFPRLADTKYEITVSTLGNEKLNNKPSTGASMIAYSTWAPATTIPAGVEISEFIAQSIDETTTGEVAFELVAGETYELTGVADCKLANVTVRGSKFNRPLIVISGEGKFVTQAGFTIKNVNVDMSDAPKQALICMSDTPDERFNVKNTNPLSTRTGYVCPGAIVYESCNFRNIPSRIFMGGTAGWALSNFRIEDCVMQINKQDEKAFISLDDSWSGLESIKLMILRTSTFYNISSVSKAYFFRVGSRAKIEDAFGPGATMVHNIDRCTFYKTFSSRHWANNLMSPQVTLNSSILYDISRPDKWFLGQSGSKVTSDKNNVAWLGGDDDGATQPMRNEMKEISVAVEDPNFKGPVDQMFNLDLPLGGVSFDPQLQICHQNQIGDPRWLE